MATYRIQRLFSEDNRDALTAAGVGALGTAAAATGIYQHGLRKANKASKEVLDRTYKGTEGLRKEVDTIKGSMKSGHYATKRGGPAGVVDWIHDKLTGNNPGPTKNDLRNKRIELNKQIKSKEAAGRKAAADLKTRLMKKTGNRTLKAIGIGAAATAAGAAGIAGYNNYKNSTREFSDKEPKRDYASDASKAAIGTGLIAGAGYGATTVKTGRLTGKVVRYHNTHSKNADKILQEGIKAKYAVDPNNLTNRVVNDVPMSDKEGLVYLAKEKKTADNVGRARGMSGGDFDGGRTLKVELEYDDIKNQKRIANPELRGAKTKEEFAEKALEAYKKKHPGYVVDPSTKKMLEQSFHDLNGRYSYFKR